MQRSVSPVVSVVVIVIVIAAAVFAWFHFTAGPEPIVPPASGPSTARGSRADQPDRRGTRRQSRDRRGGRQAEPGTPASEGEPEAAPEGAAGP